MAVDAIAVADALGAAIKARSIAQIGAVYADDIVVWHGATGSAGTKSENMGLLGAVFQLSSQLEYRNVRRHLIDGGIVQQHQLVGTFADGKPMPTLEACLVIKIREGRIARIDEYFDGNTYAEVWARLEALNDPKSNG
jgi:ketosteroid isomerase-like protein